MLPPVSLCLVQLYGPALFAFLKTAPRGREDLTLIGDSANRETPRSAACHAGSPCTRTPTLAYARTIGNARTRAPSHERALRTRAHAQTRTITHTHLRGRAGPASRARCLSTTKCEARQSRCEIDTEPMVGRRRTVRRCRPHGKPSMPKHIVGP